MVVSLQQAGAVRTPETRAELDALTARRGELRAQLRTAEERRAMLARQAEQAVPEGRPALDQRVATLDNRITDFERQLQQLDDAIVKGMADPDVLYGGADGGTPLIAAPPPPPPPLPPQEAVVMVQPHGPMIPLDGRTLLAGGLVSISLLALVGWLAFRYAVARMSRLVTGVQAGTTQIGQLQQSVDAIAVEVERISENQRFVTKLLNERAPGLAGAHGVEELERVSARLPREK